MSQPPSRRKKAKANAQSNSKQPNNPAQEEDPASATIDVTAVEVPELTEQEQRDRLHLERQIEKAFFLAGKALTELRDRRLYRSTHKTFEQYCRDRFGHSRQKSNYLIAAAEVYENLTTNGSQILPSSEAQVRPLTQLKPQQQQQAWLKAVKQAKGKVPSGRIVKSIVEQLKDKPLFSARDFCQVGDVFIIIKSIQY